MASQSSSSTTPHSAFSRLADLLHKIPNPICGEANAEGTTCAAVASAGVRFKCHRCTASKQLDKLKEDVLYIQKSLEKLRRFEQDLGKHMGRLQLVDHDAREGEMKEDVLYIQKSMEASYFLGEPRFHELARAVQQLKNQLPSASYYQFPERNYEDVPPPANESNSTDQIGYEYNSLTLGHKKCLWCFLVFPEKAEIKKRVLLNWWIGEELLQSSTLREGEEVLDLLKQKQFIKQVEMKKRRSGSWWMEPSVRSFLLSKAKDDSKLLDQKILDGKVMLLKSDRQVGSLGGMVNPVTTVFNINKPSIDETEAKALASMGSLRVLHLGRTQIVDATQSNNIQVNNLEFIIKCVARMRNLRLLSFQGISSLDKLPDSVSGLTRLMVLDLRACQALESLPLRIWRLKNLRHLDLSGCHVLLLMPSGLSSLSNLEVLKGFVIGNGNRRCCTLHDLQKLKKLHKLSIYVLRHNFPNFKDLFDLASIQQLVKLKIQWNPSLSKEMEGQENDGHQNGHYQGKALVRLRKLDLWCTPKYTATELLCIVRAFPRVKKLYIRGSDLDHLNFNHNAEEVAEWKAKTLRLLFLPKFEMTWEELKALFPQMSYLEVQDCPKLQFSQSLDEEGVWKDQSS